MKSMTLALSWAIVTSISFANAQPVPTPLDLPSTEQAIAWIDKDPEVVEAKSALAAAGHAGAAIAASPYEWTAKASGQRRRYETGGTSHEWIAQIERPIRVGGKAQLDAELGEVETNIARARLGEARHESARALADLWLGWLAATRAEELVREQLSFAEANLKAVETRQRAGDASTLDVNVARSDIIDVQRQASVAASNAAKARARLKLRFPDAPLYARPLAEPAAPAEPESQWLERIVSESDPLKIAEGQLRKAQLTAARTKADRIPDPTVGVYGSSEAFNNERVLGVSISIPFSGKYREERMRQALEEVEVARAGVLRKRRDIEVEIAETYADAVGSFERWRIANQGASATLDNATLMQRAYSLGEADLQSLLLARRQALDAARARLDARVDALRWGYRLLIDAHLIWDLERD